MRYWRKVPEAPARRVKLPAMYNFMAAPGPDTARKRERLASISDIANMESAHRMASPGSDWGKGPREPHVIQRELTRLEICRRGAALTSGASEVVQMGILAEG